MPIRTRFALLIAIAGINLFALVFVLSSSEASLSQSQQEYLCRTGRAQSPIDIVDVQETDLPDIRFVYEDVPLVLFNNGLSIQVNYAPGSTLEYDGAVYQLIDLQFRHPGEHWINGKPAAMELQLTHQSPDGRQAVVAVLIEEGVVENETFALLAEHLSPVESLPRRFTDLTINARDLLPENQDFYTYEGSLTIPPCTEGVRWLVLRDPLFILRKQLDQFASVFENNVRRLQPLNDREVFTHESS